MRRQDGCGEVVRILLLLILSAIPHSAVGAAPPEFVTIDYPGSSQTTLSGLNNRGQIVGNYRVGIPGRSFPFVWDDGVASTISFPSSPVMFNVSASGINDLGDIVGAYDGFSLQRHGFLLRDEVVSTIDYPGAVGMVGLTGLNDRDQVVGVYLDAVGAASSRSGCPGVGEPTRWESTIWVRSSGLSATRAGSTGTFSIVASSRLSMSQEVRDPRTRTESTIVARSSACSATRT